MRVKDFDLNLCTRNHWEWFQTVRVLERVQAKWVDRKPVTRPCECHFFYFNR